MLRIGIDDLDEGYFVQQASRVLHGQVPFRDFETLYSPGLVYLHAGIFAALGEPSLIAVRIVSFGARAALAMLLVGLAMPPLRHRWWAAMPALVLLLGLDDAPVRWEPHPGWLGTSFALAAVWCAGRRWLIPAGLTAALSYLFKQNTGVYILAAVLVWSGRRHFIAPLVTFGVATLAWLLPLAVAVGDPLRLGPLFGAVNQAGLLAPPESSIVIPAACLIAGWWLMRRDSDPRLRLYMLSGIAIFLTQFPRMDTLHLVWSAPLLLVVGVIALDRLPPVATIVSFVAVTVILAPGASGRLQFLGEPRASVAGFEAPVATASEINATVADIDQLTAPGEPIFVYPTSPLLYVLADRPNPTRFDHLNPGSANPPQIDQLIGDLASVKVVVISQYWQYHWADPGPNLVLEQWLSAHYLYEAGRHGAYRLIVADL